MMHRAVGAVAAAAMLLLAGCSLSIPADPDGTLERVTDGELRVGVSHSPPWTDLSGEKEPSGVEPDLVRGFAEEINADVAWETGGEEELMTRLDDGQLDMVVGGFTTDSPWTSHAALTTAYTDATGPDGSATSHVIAVQTGENAFMVAVERFAIAQNIGTVE